MTAVMEQRPPVMLNAAAGDASSFSQLIEPLLDPAFRLAAVMLADRTAAQDAVQEASIKAWRKFRQLRGDERSLRSWFLWWSVVRLAEPPRSEDSTDHYSGAAGDVRRALLRLKAEDRLPLVLHFYLDLPLDEVARTLGVSESAAKSRIYRAAQRLRPELSMEEVF